MLLLSNIMLLSISAVRIRTTDRMQSFHIAHAKHAYAIFHSALCYITTLYSLLSWRTYFFYYFPIFQPLHMDIFPRLKIPLWALYMYITFFSILWFFHFIIKIPNAFISLYIDDDQRSILIINTNSFRQPFFFRIDPRQIFPVF